MGGELGESRYKFMCDWVPSMSTWHYHDIVNGLFVVVQSLSCVGLFVTPWTAAQQAPLSFTISWSLPKVTCNQSVMLSSNLILCCCLLLLPSIFPSIRVFSNESALHIRYKKFFLFKWLGINSRVQPAFPPSFLEPVPTGSGHSPALSPAICFPEADPQQEVPCLCPLDLSSGKPILLHTQALCSKASFSNKKGNLITDSLGAFSLIKLLPIPKYAQFMPWWLFLILLPCCQPSSKPQVWTPRTYLQSFGLPRWLSG